MTDATSDIVVLRRALHRVPELSFRERETSQILKTYVGRYAELVPVADTGFYADLGPANAPRTLLLRADMDALPIQEETGLPFASAFQGRMHACGHDAHMASLAVAGKLLATAMPVGLRVRLLFQPAEEAGGGAMTCIEEGALVGVDAAFGIHVWNELSLGTIALTRGGVMAGVVEFNITITGQGGHGAIPHRTRDPVVAAAQLIMALQTVASRRIAPVEPVVLTVGSIHAGDAFNVIPGTAELKGTVRGFSSETLEEVERAVQQVCSGIAVASGTHIAMQWTRHTRPTVNDARMAGLAEAAASERMMGFARILPDYRTMAGEDFGEIAHEVPACFALVGSANPGKGLTEPHHSPRFDFDEAVLQVACDLHRAVAAEFAEHGLPATD